MLNKIDFRFLVWAIICFVVAGLIIFGKTGVTFAGPLNEIVCFILTFVWGVMCLTGVKK